MSAVLALALFLTPLGHFTCEPPAIVCTGGPTGRLGYLTIQQTLAPWETRTYITILRTLGATATPGVSYRCYPIATGRWVCPAP